jgi:hypothetical protein
VPQIYSNFPTEDSTAVLLHCRSLSRTRKKGGGVNVLWRLFLNFKTFVRRFNFYMNILPLMPAQQAHLATAIATAVGFTARQMAPTIVVMRNDGVKIYLIRIGAAKFLWSSNGRFDRCPFALQVFAACAQKERSERFGMVVGSKIKRVGSVCLTLWGCFTCVGPTTKFFCVFFYIFFCVFLY